MTKSQFAAIIQSRIDRYNSIRAQHYLDGNLHLASEMTGRIAELRDMRGFLDALDGFDMNA